MSYWKVRLDCWYAYRKEDKPTRKIRWFLVEAETDDQAFKAAREACHHMGPLLIRIEDRSASTQSLPFELKGEKP